MKTIIKTYKKFFLVLFMSIFFSPLSIANTVDFGAMVIPSLMGSNMDGWYKVPANSWPQINKVDKIIQGQEFSLLIFFRGYSADKNNNIDIRYDFQVYDPQGNPTEDKSFDLTGYRGQLKNRDALLLNQQYPKMIFTEKYPAGNYKILVTGYDKNTNKSFSSKATIELVKFSLPEKFISKKEANNWIMNYYKSPTPIKAISGLQEFVQTDHEWLKKNIRILTFFRRIFSENPFLFKNISMGFDSFSIEDKKRFAILSAIVDNSPLDSIINENEEKSIKVFYNNSKKIKIPDVTGKIYSGIQLDILWSEFLATGGYNPIRKIVSALELNKFEGTLKKIKSGEIKKITEEIKRKADLETTYGSAIWSLHSNCIQMPLVFKYCTYMYENENLNDDVKKQLGAILIRVQKELKERNKADKSKF